MMAKVVADRALQERLEIALRSNAIGITAFAKAIDVPLITLRRFRKSGMALERTRLLISIGLQRMENRDSRLQPTPVDKGKESDALRHEVIAALELLLDAARLAARVSGRETA